MVVQQRAVIVEFLGDWNIKVGSQEIPGVTGKFGFGVQNEAGQRLTEFCRENALVINFFGVTWSAETYYLIRKVLFLE